MIVRTAQCLIFKFDPHQHSRSSSKSCDSKIFKRHLRLKMEKLVCMESLVPGSTTLESMQPSSHIREQRMAPWGRGAAVRQSQREVTSSDVCLESWIVAKTLLPDQRGLAPKQCRKHRAPQEPRIHFGSPDLGPTFVFLMQLFHEQSSEKAVSLSRIDAAQVCHLVENKM